MLPAWIGIRRQVVPFQRSMRGPEVALPTAQAFRAEVAARPLREPPGAAGLRASFHFAPFQCSIRGCWLALAPTAHTSRDDMIVTALSEGNFLGLGLGTRFHAAPSHQRGCPLPAGSDNAQSVRRVAG